MAGGPPTTSSCGRSAHQSQRGDHHEQARQCRLHQRCAEHTTGAGHVQHLRADQLAGSQVSVVERGVVVITEVVPGSVAADDAVQHHLGARRVRCAATSPIE
ncbi:MAG: hypothetical protein R2713_01105 [Ilumatobacteraceae bacterium]